MVIQCQNRQQATMQQYVSLTRNSHHMQQQETQHVLQLSQIDHCCTPPLPVHILREMFQHSNTLHGLYRLGHFLFYVWGWTTIRDKLCCVLALSVRSIYVAPSRNKTILHYGKTCQVSLNCVYSLSDPLALSALSHSCPFA